MHIPNHFLRTKTSELIYTRVSSLPILTLYVNSVKLRLVMGVYTLFLDGGCPYLQDLILVCSFCQ